MNTGEIIETKARGDAAFAHLIQSQPGSNLNHENSFWCGYFYELAHLATLKTPLWQTWKQCEHIYKLAFQKEWDRIEAERDERLRTRAVTSVTNRYYVQHGEGIFLVRELQRVGDQPSAQDIIIRQFTEVANARVYAASMNELQEKLDAVCGKWVKHAMIPEATKTE